MDAPPPAGARPVNQPMPFGPGPADRTDLAQVMGQVAQGDKQAFSVLYDALAPWSSGS